MVRIMECNICEDPIAFNKSFIIMKNGIYCHECYEKKRHLMKNLAVH